MKNELHNYGLQIKDDDPNAYVLGGLIELPKIILQPNKDWTPFLPIYEPQFGGDWDSFGCTVWGTQNAIETMLKQRQGGNWNFSERFNYILANITPPGADPHHVIETIRHNGLIADSLLPMTKTYEEFLTPKPMTDALKEEGLKFPFEIKHSYIWTRNNKLTKNERDVRIREYLRYSPLGVSVTAWYEENGVFVDRGQQNTHWCVLFGIADNGWKIFDSYDQSVKILSFDHNMQMAKRFHLEPSTLLQQVSLLQKIVILLKELIAKLINKPVGCVPVPAIPPKIVKLAEAIRDYEGKPGNRNYRNNNPGNARYYYGGYLSKYGNVTKDKDGFAVFSTYELGFLYLCNMLLNWAKGKRAEWTVLELMQSYAPREDSNDPVAYSTYLSKHLDLSVETKLKSLLI